MRFEIVVCTLQYYRYTYVCYLETILPYYRLPYFIFLFVVNYRLIQTRVKTYKSFRLVYGAVNESVRPRSWRIINDTPDTLYILKRVYNNKYIYDWNTRVHIATILGTIIL